MQSTLVLEIATALKNYTVADYSPFTNLEGVPLFVDPIIAVADAADPLFSKMREPQAVGELFLPPEEWLPDAKRVISFFLPFSDEVKHSNFVGNDPSPLWLLSRKESRSFVIHVSLQLQRYLESLGYTVVIPMLHPNYRAIEKNPTPGAPSFTSSWSERHIAYICGLGTFGLSKGIITSRGMAGRLGSIITNAEIPVTPRPYQNLYDYCAHCGSCIHRCPVNAITLDGKKHLPCSDFLDDTKTRFAPHYGCGKCQVNVPCMDGIPTRD